MKTLIMIVATFALASTAALANEVCRLDARTVTCAQFQQAVATYGFCYNADPTYLDFVVSNRSFCGPDDRTNYAIIATSDNSECNAGLACTPSTSGGN